MTTVKEVEQAILMQKILAIKKRPIDSSKCTNGKSLHKQILRNTEKVSKEQIKQFDLGNGQTFGNPIEASKYLLEREYGESFLFKGKSQEAVFIPPVFTSVGQILSDSNMKEKLEETLDNLKQQPKHWFTDEFETFLGKQSDIKQDQFNNWITQMKIKYLVTKGVKSNQELTDLPKRTKTKKINSLVKENPPSHSIIKWLFELDIGKQGYHIENRFFHKLAKLPKELMKDIVVLHSVIFITNVKNKMHQEYDFLIFSYSRKLIIGVETKKKITERDSKPFDQLETYHRLIEERLSDQLGLGWTFFPVLCVEKNDQVVESFHYISKDTDIQLWLTQLLHKFQTIKDEGNLSLSLEQLKKLLQIIVFTVHVSKKTQVRPITASNWVEHMSETIDALSKKDTIVFYSKNQLPVFTEEDRYKKVIVCGGYSTGKTFLLQEKAIILNQIDYFKDNILYVSRFKHSKEGGLLYHDLKLRLELHGIEVKTTQANKLEDCLMEQIEKEQIKALFLDEWHIEKESMEKIPKCVEVIWIAPDCISQYEHLELQLQEEYEILLLELNLRNTREIVDETLSHAKQENYRYIDGISTTPENFPSSLPPVYIKQNKEEPMVSLKEALKEARKHSSQGILVVIDYLNDDVKNFVLDASHNHDTKATLKKNVEVKYYTTDETNFSAEENPCKFLNEGNILITDLPSTLGYEFPTVIYFKQENYKLHIVVSEHECNAYMRCKAQLIIVNEEGEASEYENLYPIAFERFLVKRRSIFGEATGDAWLDEDWNPIKLIDNFVQVPDDYTFDFKALYEYHKNDKERLSTEMEQEMIRCIYDISRLFELLLPILKDDSDKNVQQLRAFYGEGGSYHVLKEYAENSNEETYEKLRKRAAEVIDAFHPLLDIIALNMSWLQKWYFVKARLYRGAQKLAARYFTTI